MTNFVVVVVGVQDAGLPMVDALARLQLAAKRTGALIQVVGAPHELAGILELAGLCDVLQFSLSSGVEVSRQAEVGEQPRVQEVVDVGDPPG